MNYKGRPACGGRSRRVNGRDAAMTQPYENVVFAGGGNRCVWQAGFYRTVAEAFRFAPARAAAASAGAAVAAVLFAGRFDAALANFKRATSSIDATSTGPTSSTARRCFRTRRCIGARCSRSSTSARSQRCMPVPNCACRSRARRAGSARAPASPSPPLPTPSSTPVGPQVHPRLAPWLGFRADY